MRILQVSSAQERGGGETHLLQLVTALRNRGHHVVVAGRKDGPLHPEIPLSALRLRAVLKRERFDVVHAHVARDYPIVAGAALGIRGLTVVFTRHLLYRVRRNPLYKRADGWIAPTPEILDTLKPLRPRASAVIPNWVDLQKFPYRPHAFHDPITVGLIGQISPHKGHEDAVEAMRRLGPGYRLLIAGKGDSAYETRLKKISAALPVEYVGFVELPKFFERVDAVIVPSWNEPFGIITLEAMASGIPVIGTGPRNVLHGTFIPPRDPAALASAIRSLRPGEGVSAARKHVEENFDIRKVIPLIEKFYADRQRRARADVAAR